MTTDSKAIVSLQSLQQRMRKDPGAYVGEFKTKWRAFEGMITSIRNTPSSYNREFCQTLEFLTRVIPLFDKHMEGKSPSAVVSDLLFSLSESLHPEVRHACVTALLFLVSRPKKGSTSESLGIFEGLFRLADGPDKNVRGRVVAGIVRRMCAGGDVELQSRIVGLTAQLMSKISKMSNEKMMETCSTRTLSLARLGAFLVSNLFIRLRTGGGAKQHGSMSAGMNAGSDANGKMLSRIVNEVLLVMVSCRDPKLCLCGISILTGVYKASLLRTLIELADDRNIDGMKSASKGKEKKMPGLDYLPIELILDPYSAVDALVEKIQNRLDPFKVRVDLLGLLGKICGRRSLVHLEALGLFDSYLVPTNSDARKVVEALVNCINSETSPTDVEPIAHLIYDRFVNKSLKPEVVVIGIDALRLIASKSISNIPDSIVGLLCDLSESVGTGRDGGGNKGKSGADKAGARQLVARSIKAFINHFRTHAPSRLPKAHRGKEATLAMSNGEVVEKVFGEDSAALPDPSWTLSESQGEAEEGSDDDEDSAEDGDKASSSSDETESESEEMDWHYSKSEIRARDKRKREADEQDAEGDSDDQSGPGSMGKKKSKTDKKKRGGLSHSEKRRFKPFQMTVHKNIHKRRHTSAREKYASQVKHLDHLKKQLSCDKKKRRRV